MKRLLYLFFSLTITFLLIISAFQISVSATELSKNMRSVYGDFLYEVKNSSATITGYIGDKSSVVIPSKIDGVDVKNINPGAFQLCRNIKSVYIPNSITSIGYDAFGGAQILLMLQFLIILMKLVMMHLQEQNGITISQMDWYTLVMWHISIKGK